MKVQEKVFVSLLPIRSLYSRISSPKPRSLVVVEVITTTYSSFIVVCYVSGIAQTLYVDCIV